MTPPSDRVLQSGKLELEKLDTNKDGIVDLGEVKKHIRAEQITASYIKEKAMSEAEADAAVSEEAKDFLDGIDINNDGKIDLVELVHHFIDDDEATPLSLSLSFSLSRSLSLSRDPY